jgi:hypothetical protein
MLNGFDQISLGAEQDCFADQLRIIFGGAHDHLQAGLKFAQMLQGLKAVHAGHLHIEQDNGRSASIAQALQPLFPIVGGFDPILVEFEEKAQVALHFRGIFDQQNRSF